MQYWIPLVSMARKLSFSRRMSAVTELIFATDASVSASQLVWLETKSSRRALAPPACPRSS
eukprot:3189437-Prymnesium_polylepis.1